MKIKYRNFRNRIQKEDVRSIVKEFEQLIPPIFKQMSVQFWDENEGAYATIDYNIANLYVVLNIYGPFFAQSKKQRRITIIHEFLHLHIAPYATFVEKEVFEFVKSQNPDLSVFFMNQHNVFEENMVTNLSHFILEYGRGERN